MQEMIASYLRSMIWDYVTSLSFGTVAAILAALLLCVVCVCTVMNLLRKHTPVLMVLACLLAVAAWMRWPIPGADAAPRTVASAPVRRVQPKKVETPAEVIEEEITPETESIPFLEPEEVIAALPIIPADAVPLVPPSLPTSHFRMPSIAHHGAPAGIPHMGSAPAAPHSLHPQPAVTAGVAAPAHAALTAKAAAPQPSHSQTASSTPAHGAASHTPPPQTAMGGPSPQQTAQSGPASSAPGQAQRQAPGRSSAAGFHRGQGAPGPMAAAGNGFGGQMPHPTLHGPAMSQRQITRMNNAIADHEMNEWWRQQMAAAMGHPMQPMHPMAMHPAQHPMAHPHATGHAGFHHP